MGEISVRFGGRLTVSVGNQEQLDGEGGGSCVFGGTGTALPKIEPEGLFA